MSYLLDFDEFSFLETYGIEPNSYDKDNFLYEYKIVNSNNSDLECIISFSLFDKTFSYYLLFQNKTLVSIIEKGLTRIDAEKDKMIFSFEEENKKAITFIPRNFKLESEVNIFFNE